MEERHRSGIVITVFSTASAVGKTLISINMAAELAKQSYRVCLVDLDLQFGDVCNYLQIIPQKTIFDAQEAVRLNIDEFSTEECITQYQQANVTFAVLASPLKMEEAYNISTEAVKAVLSRLQGEYDYIVLDTSSAFSDLNLAIMDLSTIITFIGIVDFIPTIKNMKIGYDTMRSIGYDRNKIRFVLNRSNSKTRIELQDVEQLLEEAFYHVLTNDFIAARDSIHTGVPLVLDQKKTVLGQDIQKLIAKYTNRLEDNEDSTSGLSSWMKRLFK
jgi:pilus assembly protein CpaE